MPDDHNPNCGSEAPTPDDDHTEDNQAAMTAATNAENAKKAAEDILNKQVSQVMTNIDIVKANIDSHADTAEE